jgi:hypothetical protein
VLPGWNAATRMVKARYKKRCTLVSGGGCKQQDNKRRRIVTMFPGRRGG